MLSSRVKPNLVAYSALIDACSRAGDVHRAFATYGLLQVPEDPHPPPDLLPRSFPPPGQVAEPELPDATPQGLARIRGALLR